MAFMLCGKVRASFQAIIFSIKGIDTTIENLTKIKESLRISAGHLSAANNKAEDLTIKKLTKGNPTMKAAFEKVRAEKAREEGPDEQ